VFGVKEYTFYYTFCKKFQLDNPDIETTETRCRTQFSLPGNSGGQKLAMGQFSFSEYFCSHLSGSFR